MRSRYPDRVQQFLFHPVCAESWHQRIPCGVSECMPADDSVVLIDCPVDYSKNKKLTEKLEDRSARFGSQASFASSLRCVPAGERRLWSQHLLSLAFARTDALLCWQLLGQTLCLQLLPGTDTITSVSSSIRPSTGAFCQGQTTFFCQVLLPDSAAV